jgi:hypothetical protein
MLGGACSPCCTHGDCPGNREVTDPKDEGNWVPSGEWPNVTWTFVSNPGDESGEMWFFYGSQLSSGTGITSPTDPRITDWNNICNWYSTGTPDRTISIDQGMTANGPFLTRAARLPDENATVHIYSAVSTASGPPPQVQRAYFWQTDRGSNLVSLIAGSTLVTTGVVHNVPCGVLFIRGASNAGEIYGGAAFSSAVGSPRIVFSLGTNTGKINGGAVFGLWGQVNPSVFGVEQDRGRNDITGIVNGGAVFNGQSDNFGVVNDGAVFNHRSQEQSGNVLPLSGGIFGGAVFNHYARNASFGIEVGIQGGALFFDFSENLGDVFGGAQFFDNSRNGQNGTVTGGATFNDDACSTAVFGTPPYFGTSPTEPPVCNGTAPPRSATPTPTCGCG